MIATIVELSVRLAPLGVKAVQSIIDAFSRDELESMTQEQVDAIVQKHNGEIDAADARRKAALAEGEDGS